MITYVVVVEGTERSFSAYSPDLPGCVTAGDSREETLELMREAIALHLAGLREDGEPIPPATSTAEYITV